MTDQEWWNTSCDSSGLCIAVHITQNEIDVWPVYQNPNVPNYWTFKIHSLKTDKWKKIQGLLCDRHRDMVYEMWGKDSEQDVIWMERTDDWAIKNGGNL